MIISSKMISCILCFHFVVAIGVSQPVITSFLPLRSSVGTPVTINGSGFSTNLVDNIVYFGPAKAAVTSASNNQLIVSVPYGATYSPISITVLGLTAYSSYPFMIVPPLTNISQNSFTQPLNFSVGSTGCRALAVADFDLDGRVDIAAVQIRNVGLPDSVIVFKNLSTPGNIQVSSRKSFLAETGLSGTGNTNFLAVGDLDGDGRLDLVGVNNGQRAFSVLRNISFVGNISFAPTMTLSTGSTNPFDVKISDLDGDGRPDLIFSSNIDSTILVFRNVSVAGSITFDAGQQFSSLKGLRVFSAFDVDGDFKPDLVVPSITDSSICILKNISSVGNISLVYDTTFKVNTRASSVVGSDLDFDGKLDIIVGAFSDAQNIFVLKNISSLGSPLFNSPQEYLCASLGTEAYPVSSDLNGDGKPDIIVSNLYHKFSFLQNTHSVGNFNNTSFAPFIEFASDSTPEQTSVVDFDTDGLPDVITSNTGQFNTVSVIRNQGIVTGIDTEQEVIDLIMSPNPTNQFVNINIKGASLLSTFSFQVFESAGKLISYGNFTGSSHTINMSSCNSGIYIFKISNKRSNKCYIKKIVRN